MRVKKALYGVPEAGTFWWSTYYTHHKEKLSAVTSTYDPCLLITTGKDAFGLIGMQTDDTYFLGDKRFVEKEKIELAKAKLAAKPVDQLTAAYNLAFSGCVLRLTNDCMTLTQKNQGKNLRLVSDAL